MTPTYIHLESIRSTNTYLAQNTEGAVHGTVVYADCQTAGRGQRGNSWESADFKNITMSMLLRPANVKPSCQFWLSEAVALAVVHTLDRYIDNGVSIDGLTTFTGTTAKSAGSSWNTRSLAEKSTTR